MATQTATRLAAWPVYLEEELRPISEVLGVYATLQGSAIRLLVFVSDYRDEVIEKVLAVEEKFASFYPDAPFLFEVLAIPKQGSPADVVPGATQVYYPTPTPSAVPA